MNTTLFVIGAFVFVFVFFKLETWHLKRLLEMDRALNETEGGAVARAILDLDERLGELEK